MPPDALPDAPPDATPTEQPRATLHRSYTRWWLVALLLFVVTEGAAIIRRKPGDTLSEHAWRLQERGGWEGALILIVWAWLGWHLTWGARRPLGWPDAVAALAGVALWYVTVHLAR